ncbi:MAG TPA: alpha/beta hydrolase [Streptosporangiaceae bacterium]
MSRWGRVTKIAGVVAGAAAAGFGAVMAAERFAARLRPEPDSEATEPLGELRGRELVVPSDDGMPLHVEINGPDDAAVTVIFSHGYALNQDSWHYQRRDLAACARLVFWDQRGHGRSGPLAGPPVSIDRTGADLHAVIEAVTDADQRVVLVGHSMGGMTIMALAARYPELFGAKVAGLVLIGTAAGGLSSPDGLVPWMPSPLRIMLQRAVPTVLRTAARGRRAVLVEHGRKASSEIEFLATRFLAFGDPWMSVTVTDFLEQMIRQAPVGVIAEFYSALLKHDAHDVPGVLSRVPVTVVVGDRDRLIPPQLGIDLAESIDGSRLVIAEGAGHAVILERPDVVNETISSMVAQVQSGSRSQAQALRGRGGGPGVA